MISGTYMHTPLNLRQRAGHEPKATKDFVFYGPEPEDSLTRASSPPAWLTD